MSTWQPGPGDPTHQPGQQPYQQPGYQQPGYQPPYQQGGPQRPRKPKPRKVWWLLPIGLFLAALAVGIGGIALGASSFVGTEASAPMDGQPHEVTLESAERKTLWAPEGASGRCDLTDQAGAPITLDPVGGEATRSFGSGPYRARFSFDPGSETITITCQAQGTFGDQDVEIGPAVEVGRMVGGVLGGIFGGLALGAIALVAAIVLGVKTANGAPRDQARSGG